MFHRGWFWLDTNSTLLSERIVEITRHYGVVRVGPLAEALSEIPREPQRWAGVMATLDPSAQGMFALRDQLPTLPMLGMLTEPRASTINGLQARGIDLAVLPVDEARVTSFVQRAFASAFLPDDRVARVVQGLAERVELTPREVQLLSFFLGNEPRARVRKRLGVGENTLKSQVRSLIRKCGERNADALAKNVLRAALLIDAPHGTKQVVAPWFPVAC